MDFKKKTVRNKTVTYISNAKKSHLVTDEYPKY
jgi:hypothetical protein